MKKTLLLATLTALLVAVPPAAAAPTVAPDEVEPVTTEPNSTFSFDVTATNTGGENAYTSMIVEKDSLPDGFSVEKASATEVIIPTKTETFTIRMRVEPDVEPGEYSFRIFDLTNADRKTSRTVNVTVTGPTPTETEVETRTATPTATKAEDTVTPTEEPTDTLTPTPGFGWLAAAAGAGSALLARRR